MSLFRRRRSAVGGDTWRDADHALMPIPSTGGLVSCELRTVEGRPLPGVTVEILEAGELRRSVTASTTDPFGFFTAAVPAGSYRLRAGTGGYRAFTRDIEVTRGAHTALGAVTLGADRESVRPPPGRWVIDEGHSRVGFVARHIALSKVHGRFTRFSGAIEIVDPFEESTIDVVIESASIDTANEVRDTHLRSPDFLDAEAHPQLVFTSTRIATPGGSTWDVDGELTIRGRTDDVRLTVAFLGTQTWNGTRAAATATTALHREHFTLNWQQMVARGVPVVGSTVDLTLDVQAVLEL